MASYHMTVEINEFEVSLPYPLLFQLLTDNTLQEVQANKKPPVLGYDYLPITL